MAIPSIYLLVSPTVSFPKNEERGGLQTAEKEKPEEENASVLTPQEKFNSLEDNYYRACEWVVDNGGRHRYHQKRK